MKTLSVIIPAYNEETHIEDMLNDFFGKLSSKFNLLEVIVVDDGSNDKTKDIVEEYAENNNIVKCITYERNKGKGYAVRYGIDNSHGDYKIFLDADGATHIESVNELLNRVYDNDIDICIGSRSGKKGGNIIDNQSKKRSQLGGFGAKLIKKVLKMPIFDTQCGCKVFKGYVADKLFKDLKINGWLFDCEILMKGFKEGFVIKELGVKWSDQDNSKVKLISYPKSFIELIRIKINNM